MLRINNDTNRLTWDELEDIRKNSGITEIQYNIIRMRFFESTRPTVVAMCMKLCISEKTYSRELHRALEQIAKYECKKECCT